MLCLLMGLLALGASLPGTSSRDVPGKSTTPQVYLYPPHPDEMRLGSETLSLTCMIKGFVRADEIDIFWMMNNDTVPQDNYVNTPALKDNNKETFFAYSKMDIKRSSWKDGDLVTCFVDNSNVTRRSVSKFQEEK